MEEIKVGEYIRDKEGHITKIINTLSLFKDVYLYLGEDGYQYNDNAILKHSPNIIDLIEEGDVIVLRDNKKYEVLKISWSKSKGIHIHIINPLRMQGGVDIFADDIKSIVTKEQFKNIEYEVANV